MAAQNPRHALPEAASYGAWYSFEPSINIGEIENTGFDLELGYSNTALNGDFDYSADLVVSRYKNGLTKLTDVATDFYQDRDIVRNITRGLRQAMLSRNSTVV
ncbi:MAG: hypothetical protein IPI69_13225 [Bacteroidales bacterium]|nr:hypothetical protein [Bacteroidales bacterium]